PSPNTLTFDVTPANDAPVLVSGPVSATLTEDVSININYPSQLSAVGTLTYSDPDGPAPILLSDGWFKATFVSATAHGVGATVSDELLEALQLNGTSGHLWPYDADGDSFYWDFALDTDLVQYLNSGQSVEVVYSFDVADGAGATTTQQITVTINGVDDHAPVITSGPGAATVVEDASVNAPAGNRVTNGGFESGLDGWSVS